MYVLRPIGAYLKFNSTKMTWSTYKNNRYAIQNFVELTSEQFGFWS